MMSKKVRWLNDDCTAVEVTKGWRRRRTATLTRRSYWYYANGAQAEEKLDGWLDRRRRDELTQRRIDVNWVPVHELPRARLLK